MRINSLSLKRYGHFNDYTFDFPKPNKTKPDLHLIYGANEAGKSTTLHALIDLLYGMPRTSTYSFMHGASSLAIAAQIQQGTQANNVVRYKNKLTDVHDSPVNADVIDTHGLSRQAFVSRFSFDEDRLREGGEAILKSEGDLGTALFSATSGIASFSESLDALLAPANAFYEKGKKKDKQLTALRAELKEVQEQLKQIEVKAADWKKRRKDAKDKQDAYQSFADLCKQKQQLLRDANSKLAALSQVRLLRQTQDELGQYAKLPETPDNWLELARTLSQSNSSSKASLAILQDAIIKTNKNIEQNKPDTALLQYRTEIEALTNQQSLVQQKTLEVNAFDAEYDELDARQSRLSARLQTDVEIGASSLLIDKPTLSDITDLVDEYSSIEQQMLTAKGELQSLTSAQDHAAIEPPVEPKDFLALQSCLQIAQDEAHHQRLIAAQDNFHSEKINISSKLLSLTPWRGDLDALNKLSTPSSNMLDKLKEQLISAASSVTVVERQLTDLQQQRTDLNARIAGHEPNVQATITNTTSRKGSDQSDNAKHAAEALRKRDRRWREHLEAIDTEQQHIKLQKTARDFTVALQATDHTQQQLLAATTNIVQQQQYLASLNSLNAELELKQHELDQAHAQQQRFSVELQAIALSLSLHESAAVADIETWLLSRTQLIDMGVGLAKLEEEVRNLDTVTEAMRSRLITHLLSALPEIQMGDLENADYTEVMKLAQQSLDRLRAQHSHYTNAKADLQKHQKQLATRTAAVTDAEQRCDNWQKRWDVTLAGTWLNEFNAKQVKNLIPELQKLQQVNDELQACEQRRASAQKIIEQHQLGLATLLNKPEFSTGSAQLTLDGIHQKLVNAINTQTKHDQAIQRHDELAKQVQELEHDAAPVIAQLNEMKTHCGAKDTIELQATLEKIRQRSKLQSTIRETKTELKQLLQTNSQDDAVSLVADSTTESLQATITELQQENDVNQVKLTELHSAYTIVQNELDAFHGDAEVASLYQQHANILLEIEQQAEQALELRLGRIAIQQAIRRFRDKNKSSMMRRAKDAFTRITCDNFDDIRTQPGKKNSDTLVGIKRDGPSVMVEDMSQGTRTQLYLSLRVAAYQEYCDLREPLPFVADDIMETFDDDRSAATFGVLADMALHGQIIYLTHHRHLIDIARDVVGSSLNVHEIA